jgi:hypothetical protein
MNLKLLVLLSLRACIAGCFWTVAITIQLARDSKPMEVEEECLIMPPEERMNIVIVSSEVRQADALVFTPHTSML